MKAIRILAILALVVACATGCKVRKDKPADYMSETVATADSSNVPAGDINTVAFSPEDFMRAFFGNYHPALGISAIDPKDLNISWTRALNLEEYYPYPDEPIDRKSREHKELLTLLGKVPFELVQIFAYPPDRYLMVFAVKVEMFGPENTTHTAGVPVGMAVYKWNGMSWKCGHYNLEVGRYGSWGRVGASGRFPISADNYAFVIGESIGVGHYFTLLDDKPALILSAYIFDEGEAYDSYNSWKSMESYIDTGRKFHDFVIESEAARYEGTGTIRHYRRYRFDEEQKRYRMIESRGDFTESPDLRYEYDGSED